MSDRFEESGDRRGNGLNADLANAEASGHTSGAHGGDANHGRDAAASDELFEKAAAGHNHDRVRKQRGEAGGNNGTGGGGQVPVPRHAGEYPVDRVSQFSPDLYGRDLLGGASASQEDEIALNYRKYIGILIKQRWLIASVTAVTLAIGLVYTLLQTPVYRASATIQIKREVANISGVANVEPVVASHDAEFYQTQYELLKSRTLAERVVSSLNLADSPALFEPPPSGWEKLHDLLFPQGHADAPNISERQKMALVAVLSGLSVEPVRFSSIVRINFDSLDPVVAQKVANGIADNFIVSNMERSFEATAYARKFLEERLQELRLKLQESERALVEYAEQQEILSTGSEQSLSTVNLAGINSALADAAKERLRQETRWQQLESMDGLRLPQALESEAITELRARRAEMVLDYEDKLKVYKPGFPDMVRLRTRIDEVDEQIKDEVTRIKESLNLQYQAALQEEQALRQQLSDMKSEVMDYQNRKIQYTILQREVDTNRSLYEGLLQRYKEIGVAGGIHSNNAASNVSFVDKAQVPRSPYKPSISRNLAVALFVGLMLGGATAFGREFLDSSYRSPEDLEEGLGLPLLGVIPLSEEISELEQIVNDQRSAPAEAYRSLRTALQFSTVTGTPKTLVITSALPGEGKSTAAVNVAGQFAKLGLRVLLIDADLRKPSLHRRLGCDDSVGLTQYLIGGSTPAEALQATALPNLTLLACGPLPPNPAELLAGERMASLLSVAAEEFDLVIVDAPPVAGLADAPLLASMSLGTLLVVEANRTHRRVVAAALKRLLFARAEVVGVVFNKFDSKQTGYGYGYGYGDDSYYGYGEQKSLADAKDA